MRKGSSYAPSATKADVVGEDGGPVDVVVPMDGVDAVEHGDPEARGHGTPLDLVDHLHPLSRCRVGSRDAATTAQHAPCSAAPQDRSINLFCNAWPHACMHFFFP